LGIECGQRLIEKEDVGLEHQRAGECDALSFAAGELRGAAVLLSRKADEIEDVADTGVDIADAMAAKTKLDVLADGEMRKECVTLEDGADITLVGLAMIDGFAVEKDVAGGGLFEAGDQAEGGRFAASGRPEEGEEFAARHREGDAVEGPVSRVFLYEVAQLQDKVHGKVKW